MRGSRLPVDLLRPGIPLDPLQRLVTHHTEQVRSDGCAAWVVGTTGAQELEEALLHDVFGIGRGTGHAICKPEKRCVVVVEQLDECGFISAAGCRCRIHGCLNGITASSGNGSVAAVFAPAVLLEL